MRIQCPDCSAQYEVPDDRLVAGRTVRCARCGRDWTPVALTVAAHDAFLGSALETGEAEPADTYDGDDAVDPAPQAPAAAPPVRAPAADPATQALAKEARPRSRALGAAWVASLLVIAGAVWAAVAFRDPVAAAWPPSLRVYDALHLPVASGH